MRPTCVLAACILFVSSYASAATIFQFKDASLSGGTPVTGTVTIDITAGTPTALNVTVGFEVFSLSNFYAGNTSGDIFLAEIIGTGSMGDMLRLELPLTTDLTGYTGGDLCSLGAACHATYFGFPSTEYSALVGSSPTNFSSGSLAATPEPSGLFLLATGLLGTVRFSRRRTVQA